MKQENPFEQIFELNKLDQWREFVNQMTFSFSNIVAFETCKHCWFKNYALGIREYTKNPFSDYGTLMHKIIENLDKNKWNKDYAKEIFITEMEKINLPTYYNVDLNVSYYEQGISFIDNYSPIYAVLCTEKEVKFKVGDYNFQGFIDKVAVDKDNNIYIIDHKSKGRFKSKKELDHYARQLYLYSIPIIEKTGKYPKKLIFNLFRKQRLEEIEFKKEDFEKAQEWAIGIIEEMKDTIIFPVTENEYVKNELCKYKNHQDHLDNVPLKLDDYKLALRWKYDYSR